ncbi:MAG: hypothetical protein LBQ97_04490 [Fusobacteriaceae bacterium]|nr:hypothetical protein [Fusobacteriaceae bacterium]
MQALEFFGEIIDGAIPVPDSILKKVSKTPLKIVLMQPQAEIPEKEMKFDAIRLKTKNLKFNRDELHER